jgi:hypothetical protein
MIRKRNQGDPPYILERTDCKPRPLPQAGHEVSHCQSVPLNRMTTLRAAPWPLAPENREYGNSGLVASHK